MSQRYHSELFGDGRLHLRHGRLDLVVEAIDEPVAVRRAYLQAEAAFDGLSARLDQELPLLRRPVGAQPPALSGPVARRMLLAVWPHRRVFVTPMAALAGAVADTVMAAMVDGLSPRQAYINIGGDIALYLAPGERFRIGLAAALAGEARAVPEFLGVTEIDAAQPVRGIATSGRGGGGLSLSLGIADAVTVLAADAAAADAAATLIANAVDVDHPAIRRAPAREVVADSDLGDLPVTVAVGALPPDAVADALAAGATLAESMRRAGLIAAAALSLASEVAVVGPLGLESAATAGRTWTGP